MSLEKLSDRKRLLMVVLIMVGVAVTSAGIWGWGLYRAALNEQRNWLLELVQSQARMIEAVALLDVEHRKQGHPEEAGAATISQILDAYNSYDGFGKSGEFVLGRREGDKIVFLDTGRRHGKDVPKPVPFNPDMAEPMYHALLGHSGTTIGPDYRGVMVLAAYEPVAILNIGIVAKIDLVEIRAPFFEVGIIGTFGALFIIILGGVLTYRINKPFVERLEARTEELSRSNEELEQFAYVASHDLQEPLRMVASFTELLAKKYEGRLDEKADKYIHYAVDGAKRMQELINDLLSFSRIGTKGKDIEPTDSSIVVKEVMDSLMVMVRENKVEIELGRLPEVMADRWQLTQLFQNLIRNAIKFKGDDHPRIEIKAAKTGREWTFSVYDNGIGIDPEFFDRIFIIFQRLHERGKYSGTGLGLAISKKIVERHGGRIWVESEPGKGTTFFFTLSAIYTL